MSRWIDADKLIKDLDKGLWGKDWDKALAEAIITEAPSIDIEPKRGEWIGTRIGHYPGYECSLCHYGVQPWNTTNFCPNCGAKMKGADDEMR